MYLINKIFNLIIDSLFPQKELDTILFSYKKEELVIILPKAKESPIRDAYSLFSYKDRFVTRLIWNIKYKKTKIAIEMGGYVLFHKIKELFQKQILIVPIPITEKRRKERGFNQCELLLDEIIKYDKNKDLIPDKDILIRNVHKDRQTLKNREARLEDAKNIFSINKNSLEKIREKINLSENVVVVIDDVITTGSTMNEAIETIKEAGFKKVYGLSLAH